MISSKVAVLSCNDSVKWIDLKMPVNRLIPTLPILPKRPDLSFGGLSFEPFDHLPVADFRIRFPGARSGYSVRGIARGIWAS